MEKEQTDIRTDKDRLPARGKGEGGEREGRGRGEGGGMKGRGRRHEGEREEA